MQNAPKFDGQFSLRFLMTLVTVCCILFAVPKGYLLLIILVTWVSMIAIIARVLFIFRAPIYQCLSGEHRAKRSTG